MTSEVLHFPNARTAALTQHLPLDEELPVNVVLIPWLARMRRQHTELRAKRIEARQAQFPELTRSPELALALAIYAELPKMRRERVARSIRALALDYQNTGAEAPAVAADLLRRIDIALERVRRPTPPKR